MAKVIIFGVKDLAELAHFYFVHDSEHEVVAFSVNAEYMPENELFCGLPVIPFEQIETRYPPDDYCFFAAMTHRQMNKLRERIYQEIKGKGYHCLSYISSKATIFDRSHIGDNCFILEDNTIQPFVSIGNNVVLWSGNHIGHHSVIQDHVFFTSHVVLSGHCRVEPYCFVGVNAAIKDRITLGEGTFIAMSTTITKNTEPYSVYSGNPAQKMKMSSLDIRF
jgi:sugar O-acyltransferase (sialic acid O-acetyltransferase NeuD family)